MSPDALDIASSVPNCIKLPLPLIVLPPLVTINGSFRTLPAPSAAHSQPALPLVCARGCFRSQQPPEALSCMQNRFSMHTTASTNSLLCAPGVISAPMSLLLTPPGCARGLFRSRERRSATTRVHWSPFPHTRTSCCRGKQLTPTGYGLRPILPSLSAGPLPLTSRGRLRPPGVSSHSALRHHHSPPSRVRWSPFPFTGISFCYHSCALEPVSAPISLLLMPPVCTRSHLRTHVTPPDPSCVRWRPFLLTGASE